MSRPSETSNGLPFRVQSKLKPLNPIRFAMASGTGFRFRLNQYNWFGQKLLAQHRYSDINGLCNYLNSIYGSFDPLVRIRFGKLSEHLRYINGLALMKTSVNLDDLVTLLQQLNFNKNSQYFLLLCQCLMYIGQHDSIIELCKQVIGKQINVIAPATNELVSDDCGGGGSTHDEDRPAELLRSIGDDAKELNRVMDCIRSNALINDSRLWYLFALALQQQNQLQDANAAFEVSIKLADGSHLGAFRQASAANKMASGEQPVVANRPPLQVDALRPFMLYAEFCIKYKRDFKFASQIIATASSSIGPLSYPLNPMLALAITSQPASGQSHFTRALELVSSVEALLTANKNPSQCYNQLAGKFRRRLNETTMQIFNQTASKSSATNLFQSDNQLDCGAGDCCFAADQCPYSDPHGLALARSHITMNSFVQESDRLSSMYETSQFESLLDEKCRKRYQTLSSNSLAESNFASQVDNLIDTLKSCPTTDSPGVWNNLGLCLLKKRRFVACLSCLMQAHRLDQLDWRINYNLALAYLHVGLAQKALTCLLAARALCGQSRGLTRRRPSSAKGFKTCTSTLQRQTDNCIISLLIAICSDLLDDCNEARRVYIETVCQRKTNATVLAIVNYIAFLHKNTSQAPQSASDESAQDTKLILRLLDQLEQIWLQRDQNDPQFNSQLLNVAQYIAETIGERTKTYAWTKVRKGSDANQGQADLIDPS